MINEIKPTNSELIMYQTDDGQTRIDVKMEDETVWLSKAQMAKLFQRDRSVISKHIKNVFEEGELDRESNVQILHIANSNKPVEFFNLDVIISVGYRVKSQRGTQFRIWETKVLKEYMIKGFALNDERLKGNGGGNYWKKKKAPNNNGCSFMRTLRQAYASPASLRFPLSVPAACGPYEIFHLEEF